MKLRPTRNRVVIKYLKVENKTKGGILLPNNKEKPQTTGIVVATSTDDLGELLNKDDIVLFGKYVGTPVKIQDEDFVIMNYKDIIAVIEK